MQRAILVLCLNLIRHEAGLVSKQRLTKVVCQYIELTGSGGLIKIFCAFVRGTIAHIHCSLCFLRVIIMGPYHSGMICSDLNSVIRDKYFAKIYFTRYFINFANDNNVEMIYNIGPILALN